VKYESVQKNSRIKPARKIINAIVLVCHLISIINRSQKGIFVVKVVVLNYFAKIIDLVVTKYRLRSLANKFVRVCTCN